MAISIKNHEDRITALENRKGYYSETLLFGGKWNSLGAGNERISLTSSVRNYDKIRLITTNNDYTMNMCDFPVTDYLNRKSVSVDFDQGSSILSYISDTVAEVSNGTPNYLYAVYGLKLYYNFSYNITREFYKVKFNKLRHYLCSHLQNYASNKGGVIQNGY